jgi:hypothetical protein
MDILIGFGGRFRSVGHANQSVNLFRSRSQVTSALSLKFGSGSRSRNLLITLGRDDGFDSVQWIISALNGLSSLAGLQHQSASRDRISLHG